MPRYIEDPIGLALIDLYEHFDTVTAVARLDKRGWTVRISAVTDGERLTAEHRSVGQFDPGAAFTAAAKSLTERAK